MVESPAKHIMSGQDNAVRPLASYQKLYHSLQETGNVDANLYKYVSSVKIAQSDEYCTFYK